MLICVTNRNLCKDDFINRIGKLAEGKPYAIMLREKDLCVDEIEILALKLKEICNKNNINLIINKDIVTAIRLQIPNIHLSMDDLRKYKNELKYFKNIGASVHSISEAKEAQELGASYLVAGHIFSTDCKRGVPPRGVAFLKEVCDSVVLPVYAIGGITKDKIEDVLKAGAKGFCVMSEAMTCLNPEKLANDFSINY